MKRKIFISIGSVIGFLILLYVVLVVAAPLWQRLGVKPVCLSGDWPHVKVSECSQVANLVTPLPLPTAGSEGPIPLIFDDDGSPDGTIALLYFLRNPLFDVKAVTISCGEAHPDIFAEKVLLLLAGVGRGDIPVGFGRDTPLEGNNAFPDPWRESSDAFWNIPLPPATVTLHAVPAAQLIVDTINASSQPVRLFVSGNHTNLAEAMRLDPEIAGNIRDIYIMGGSIYVPGNIKSDWPSIDNSVAEWNIWVDPLAASEVFQSGLPVHVSPLDATDQILWTQTDALVWADSAEAEGQRAAGLLNWMLQSWSPNGVYIWDLVAAINASDSRLCPTVSLSLEIVTTHGLTEGQMLPVNNQPTNASVCLKPDAGLIRARAADTLTH